MWLKIPQRQRLPQTPCRRARLLWPSSAGKSGPQSSPELRFTSSARWRRQPRSRRPRARRQPPSFCRECGKELTTTPWRLQNLQSTGTGRYGPTCVMPSARRRSSRPRGQKDFASGSLFKCSLSAIFRKPRRALNHDVVWANRSSSIWFDQCRREPTEIPRYLPDRDRWITRGCMRVSSANCPNRPV